MSDAWRLLPEQLRFYYLHAMDPSDPDIYICRTLRIRGEVDLARLRASALALARRHDVLRGYCRMIDGEPRLLLRDDVESAIRVAEPDEAGVDAPFDLENGPLFRITIARAGAETRVVLRFHHLIVDGTSVRLFVDELLDGYAAERSRPAHQFCDRVQWEARQPRADNLAYWSKVLAAPSPLELDTRPRPPRHTKRAHTLHVDLDAELVAAIRQTCRRHYVTPYIVVATLTQILLHAVTGATDVVIGTPVAARPRREFQTMLGVMVSWIALRARISPEATFDGLLGAARNELPEAYARQCAYATLLAAARVARDPARSPLFQVTVNYARHEPLRAPAGWTVELDPVEVAATHADLALRFEEVGDRVQLGVTYYADAIERASAERWCAGFVALARRCLANEHARLGEVVPADLVTPARRVAIAATFTVDTIRPQLAHWLDQVGLSADIAIAPLDQVFQTLLDPAGIMATNHTGANVVLVRLADWKDPAHGVRELQRVLATQAERSTVPTIVISCPGDEELEVELARVAACRRVTFVSWRDIVARYPVDVIAQADTEHRAPYTSDFEAALAIAVARAVNAVLRPAPKVLVLDCDHTLWRGVVGEDGPAGLVIEAGHAKLQRMAANAARAGVLLCLASKNVEADVWAAFAATPGFVLTRAMITAHRIDWQPKSASLRALAKELDLGLDAFVFLDDSPVECAEVRAACPEVLVLQVPPASEPMSRFLDHLWPLDPRPVTASDRARAAFYAANAQRERIRAAASDLTAFVASLEVATRFLACTDETIARAAQLTQRTNQFTTTTRRRTEADFEALRAAGGEALLIDASDRFGDYGIVGCVVYRLDETSLAVDTFVLSCRALGRGIEQAMVAELGRRARLAGRANVTIEIRRSARNKPARAFFEAIAGADRVGGADDDTWSYVIPAAEAEVPRLLAALATEVDDPPADLAVPVLHDVWRRLATLDTVPRIRREVDAALARRRDEVTAFVPPRDELEATLAAIWAEVLHVDAVGIEDDYFALGGDSIRILGIVARLAAAGLPVTVADIHHDPTVARLAERLRGRALEPRAKVEHRTCTGPYPLAFAQRYVLAAYAGGAFQIADRFTLHDPRGLSVDALCRATRLLVAKIPILHAVVARDGSTQDTLLAYADPVRVEDLTALAPPARDAAIAACSVADRARRFDPHAGTDAMIRLTVLVTSASSCVLLVTAHHAFCDGWSLHAFYSRLVELYRALVAGDDARVATITHALDAGATYHELVDHERHAAHAPHITAFWRAYLATRPLAPVAHAAHARRSITRHMEPRVMMRATERVRSSRTSLKAVLLEAMALALPPSPIAVVTNGRHEALAHPTEVFGLCWTLTPVVVRRALARDARLAAVHADLLATEAHARLPITEMFGGHDPIAVAPVSFNLTHFHHATWSRARELEVTRDDAAHGFHFPLDVGIQLRDRVTVTMTSTQHDEDALHALVERFVAELA